MYNRQTPSLGYHVDVGGALHYLVSDDLNKAWGFKRILLQGEQILIRFAILASSANRSKLGPHS